MRQIQSKRNRAIAITAATIAAGVAVARSDGQEILRDDFNGSTLNTSTWQVMTHQVGRSRFGNVPVVSSGFARLRHDTYNPQAPGGLFRGTELASNAFLSRGTVGIEMEARVRTNAMPNGLVTSFFTYNYRVEGGTGFSDEADFEVLTNRVNAAPASGDPVQLTTFNDFNNTTLPFGDEVTQSSREVYINGFDTSQFNTMKFRWLPNRLEWYVNGRLYRTVTGSLLPTDATRLRFNFWAPSTDWTAAYSSALQPTNNPANNVPQNYDVDWVVVRNARPAVTASAPNRLFTDRFVNNNVANSDSISGFWQTRNQGASSSVTESPAVPLRLTAGGAGFPHAQIASAVRSEFNMFEAPIEIEATGINFDSQSGSYAKSFLRFALSSQALTAGTQSEFTSEDAFSIRIGGDNSVAVGYKLNAPNVSTEFEGTNLLNQTVSGPVRRVNFVMHPDFFTLKVEHDLSLTDSTPTTSQFNGALSIPYDQWAALSAATGSSALYVQSQLANALGGESTTVQLESMAVNAIRPAFSNLAGGDWTTAGNWSLNTVPNYRGANAILPAVAAARTININQPITLGKISFDGTATQTLGGSGSILLNTPAPTSFVDVFAGNHQINVPVSAEKNVNVTIGTGASLTLQQGISSTADLNKSGTGALKTAHVRAQHLNIAAGEVRMLSAAPNSPTGASRVTQLTIAANARLALENNAMVIDYTGASPIEQIRQHLAEGASSGNGITSQSTGGSRAAYFEATDLYSSFPATFAGQSLDESSVLLAYTLAGDANLDFTVNISDFAVLAANFNLPSRWVTGDFDYSGTTNISDFSLLAAQFNQSLPLGRSSIPEPGAAVALLSLLAARRRNSARE